jgi:hypothetical protein
MFDARGFRQWILIAVNLLLARLLTTANPTESSGLTHHPEATQLS